MPFDDLRERRAKEEAAGRLEIQKHVDSQRANQEKVDRITQQYGTIIEPILQELLDIQRYQGASLIIRDAGGRVSWNLQHTSYGKNGSETIYCGVTVDEESQLCHCSMDRYHGPEVTIPLSLLTTASLEQAIMRMIDDKTPRKDYPLDPDWTT